MSAGLPELTFIPAMLRIVCCLVLLSLLGCSSAPTAPPRKSGFLSDYARLEQATPSSLRWIDEGALRAYTTFVIDPVVVYLHDEAREHGRDADYHKQQTILSYTHAALRGAIEDRYTVVARPGPGVARVRVALTDIDETRPFAKLVTLGRDSGGASMEAEIVDSVTGEQLAAIVEVQDGSSVPMEQFGPMDDTRDIVDAWARRFRERLDAIHGAR